MQRLEGKVAIVTGAGQGIGRAIATAFAEEGAKVTVAGRTEQKLHTLRDELAARSLEALPVRCDVGVREDIEATVQQTLDAFGRIDILVNNAAIGYEKDTEAFHPIQDTTEEFFRKVMDVNLVGTFLFMKACFPHMKDRGGKIINMASAAGTEGVATLSPYASSKEGVRALTRVAAREWGQHKINVNVIAPFAMSPGQEDFKRDHPDLFANVLAETPLGFVGDCKDDIAPVVVFLASEESRYLTGHTFMLDGGRFTLR